MKKAPRRRPKSHLLGVGLDNEDGHKRITSGDQFTPVGGSLDGVSEDVFRDVAAEVPNQPLARALLDGAGAPLVDLVVAAGLAPSKGQARKDLEAGGIYLNNARAEFSRVATSADLLFGKYLLLRKGKRTYALLTAA